MSLARVTTRFLEQNNVTLLPWPFQCSGPSTCYCRVTNLPDKPDNLDALLKKPGIIYTNPFILSMLEDLQNVEEAVQGKLIKYVLI